MLYGEKLKEILSKTGVDTTTLPDNLFSTILQAISDNIGNNTGGITPTGELSITENGTYDVTNYASANVNVAASGGSGEITHEQAYTKLFPNGTQSIMDLAEVIAAYTGMGATLGEFKLYYTNESTSLGNEVSKISAGSLIIMVTKINMTTMEINIYVYGNKGMSLEYNTSNFYESGYLVSLGIGAAITDITSASGQYLPITGF